MYLHLTMTDKDRTQLLLNSNHVIAVFRSAIEGSTTVVCVSAGGNKKHVYYAVKERPNEISGLLG